jgi:ABC-2 type transport system ATP-binding protein
MGAAIEIRGMSKRFGKVEAVRDLSFEVQAGRVTGFLGPNGAGKSTTLRMLLGLIHAGSGEGTFGGRRYEELPHPSAHVGVVLEEASFHPGRSGRTTFGCWPPPGTIPTAAWTRCWTAWASPARPTDA